MVTSVLSDYQIRPDIELWVRGQIGNWITRNFRISDFDCITLNMMSIFLLTAAVGVSHNIYIGLELKHIQVLNIQVVPVQAGCEKLA